MHIHTRLPIVAALLLAVIPLATIDMMASVVQRDHVQEEFEGAVEEAFDHGRLGRSLLRDRKMQQEYKSKLVHRLSTVERERRKLQRQIRNLQLRETLHGSAPAHSDNQDAVALTQKLESNRFSGALSVKKASRFLRRLMLNAGLHMSAPTLPAISRAENVIALSAKDQDLFVKEKLMEADFVRSDSRVRATTQQLAAARQMMRQIQDIVFELQEHLVRINAQIERKQERERIAQGLSDPLRNKYAPAQGRPVEFMWPAVARISAGFREPSYQRFFGIPHNGIDIVVPQGTPVKSAADGVVFMVRNGGMGYSYVLIAHRQGYATLYGHLSHITVQKGDEVSAGDIIGLSGGAKGTPGAGIVTTGAHLHFEVTKNGKHIDPKTVLP